ncbi:MAG TPA: Ppx/GppA family phosphatase [Sphingomicrobium sp.]|nr:Ppx/GppA family phosphatase [Sphingomicrobium sp.]
MPSRKPIAIIDIGSNSVRLVVYAGNERVPRPIFNEKVLAGLGVGVGETGRISSGAWGVALAMLERFKLLLRYMGVRNTRVVATAAVRDADNGPEFVDAVERIGFECRILGPEEEAWYAGEGVLSAIPSADGVVGDLGGGSLELVEVRDGLTGRGISLPLGVLRVRAGDGGKKEAAAILRSALRASGLREKAEGRTLYLVGGSWRALARIDMIASHYPLPITHGYVLRADRLGKLRKLAEHPRPDWSEMISPARAATLPAAAMLLRLLAKQLKPKRLVVSTFGIREGLLFADLSARARQADPLITAARDAGGADRRFGEHGDLLDSFINPLFDDGPAARRIRLASCVLADVAWQADPEFRGERGVEMALHGNWVGVTAPERVMMAEALSANFGRAHIVDRAVTILCSHQELVRADQWGLAMRLGQRLSGGVGQVLERAALRCDEDNVTLCLPRNQEALLADPVWRRLERLAVAMGRSPAVDVSD